MWLPPTLSACRDSHVTDTGSRHDVLSLVTGQARLKLEALSDRYTSDDAMLGYGARKEKN